MLEVNDMDSSLVDVRIPKVQFVLVGLGFVALLNAFTQGQFSKRLSSPKFSGCVSAICFCWMQLYRGLLLCGNCSVNTDQERMKSGATGYCQTEQ